MSRIRAFLERLLRRYYEGPEMPMRLAEEARFFAVSRPMATPEDWEDFAVALARKGYTDGYVRGLEHSQRMPKTEEEKRDDEERHAWMHSQLSELSAQVIADGDPNDPLRGVPIEERAELFDKIGQIQGTHRVVLLEDEPPVGFEPDDDD